MELLGKPSEEFMDKISSDSVNNSFVEIQLTCLLSAFTPVRFMCSSSKRPFWATRVRA